MKQNDELNSLGSIAQDAAIFLRGAPSRGKNKILLNAAENIRSNACEILEINSQEVSSAEMNSTHTSMVDRLRLDEHRLASISKSLLDIAGLPDPVGEIAEQWERPNGLEIERVRVPIGVLAIIYESRPNVTIDAAALALKSGNPSILRGGSECAKSSRALFECFRAAIEKSGFPKGTTQFISSTDRAIVGSLLSGLNGSIDLIIPRGGKSLIERVNREACVPVLSHQDGLNSVYIDRAADRQKAIAISVNSKMRRPSVCGAAENLLIDQGIDRDTVIEVIDALLLSGCEVRGDQAAQKYDARIQEATDLDWSTEYLAPILSVAVVDGVTGALENIARYSSGHTDAIVTEDIETANIFLNSVDSAIVIHNASTQFADGGEFGLGAEIGIATGRLHARGPVGVRELTTYKNVVRGAGQIRE